MSDESGALYGEIPWYVGLCFVLIVNTPMVGVLLWQLLT